MALSGKLAQVDSESYVDVAAKTSECEPKFFLVHCTSVDMCEDHQSKRRTRAGNDYLLRTNCKKRTYFSSGTWRKTPIHHYMHSKICTITSSIG